MPLLMKRFGRALFVALFGFGVMTSLASQGQAADKQVFQSDDLPSGLPFSPAVKAGGFVFLAGALGIVPGEPRLVPGGIGPETRQALTYLKQNLELAGSTLDKVVKCTVFLADMGDFRAMNAVYREFFPTEPPARTTVAVAGLALGARTEIECIALAGD